MMKWWALFFVSGKFISQNSANRILLAALPHLLFAIHGYFVIKKGRGRGSLRDLPGGLRPAPRFILVSVTSLIILFTSGAHNIHDNRKDGFLEKAGSGNTGTAENIKGILGRPGYCRVLSLTARTRRYCIGRLAGEPLSREASSLLRSLILGDRADLSGKIKEDYRYIGISHFLALSGLHLGLIVIPLSFIMGALPLHRRLKYLFLAVFIITYTAVAGYPPSLCRAAAMYLSVLFFRVAGVNADLFESLTAASFILFLIRPGIIFDSGFRLSFLAVAGIHFLAIPQIRTIKTIFSGIWKRKLFSLLSGPVIITLSVNLFTLPVVLRLYRFCPLISPAVNILMVIPFMLFIYAGGAYFIAPGGVLRSILAVPINITASFLRIVPEKISSHYFPSILESDIDQRFYIAGISLLCISIRSKKRITRFVSLAAALMTLIYSAGGKYIMGASDEPLNANSGKRIRPSAEWSLTELKESGSRVLTIREEVDRWRAERILRNLREVGIGKVGYIFIILPGIRTFSGIEHLVNRLGASEVFCSRYLYEDKKTRLEKREKLHSRLRPLSRGDVIRLGGTLIRVESPLYPPPEGRAMAEDETRLRFRRENSD